MHPEISVPQAVSENCPKAILCAVNKIITKHSDAFSGDASPPFYLSLYFLAIIYMTLKLAKITFTVSNKRRKSNSYYSATAINNLLSVTRLLRFVWKFAYSNRIQIDMFINMQSQRSIRIRVTRCRNVGLADKFDESSGCNHAAFTSSSLAEKQMSGCWPQRR